MSTKTQAKVDEVLGLLRSLYECLADDPGGVRATLELAIKQLEELQVVEAACDWSEDGHALVFLKALVAANAISHRGAREVQAEMKKGEPMASALLRLDLVREDGRVWYHVIRYLASVEKRLSASQAQPS